MAKSYDERPSADGREEELIKNFDEPSTDISVTVADLVVNGLRINTESIRARESIAPFT